MRKPMLCPETGRIMYLSRPEAALEAEELSDEFAGVLCAYPCRFCGAFHIGSISLENLRQLLKEVKTETRKNRKL